MSDQGRSTIDDFEDAEPPPRRIPAMPALAGAAVLIVILIAAGLVWHYVRSDAGSARPPAETSAPAIAGAEPATAVPPAPPEFNRRVIADWIYACGAANGTDCAITQTLTYSGAIRMQVSWRLEKAADGTFVSAWTVPTNILVRRGLVLDLGGGKPAAIPLDSCSPTSCEVRANLAADFVDTLKKAPKIATSVVFKNSKGFTFDFSTKGLGDALTALAAATPTGP